MPVGRDAVRVQQRVERRLGIVLDRRARVAVRMHLEHELARVVHELGSSVTMVMPSASGVTQAATGVPRPSRPHEAHAAGAAVGEPVVLADGGHVGARGAHGVEDGGAVASRTGGRPRSRASCSVSPWAEEDRIVQGGPPGSVRADATDSHTGRP